MLTRMVDTDFASNPKTTLQHSRKLQLAGGEITVDNPGQQNFLRIFWDIDA
jgi:hypothetical protein